MELSDLQLKRSEWIRIGAGSSTELSIRIINLGGALHIIGPANCMQKELRLDINGFTGV